MLWKLAQLFGYARVSSADQDISIQQSALKTVGAGSSDPRRHQSRNGRSELETLMQFLQGGDTLVVTRIDRLARSMRDLQNIVYELREKGVHLKATEQPVDTASAAGKAFLDMLGVFAEFETNLRRERQMEGIAAAKKRGVYKGRPRSIDAAKIDVLRSQGLGASAIARKLGIARASVYRTMKGRSLPSTA